MNRQETLQSFATLKFERLSARSFQEHSSQIHHIGVSSWIGHSLSIEQFHNRAINRDQTGRSATPRHAHRNLFLLSQLSPR